MPTRLPGSVQARSGLNSRAPRDHETLRSSEWHLWEPCGHSASSLSFPRSECFSGSLPTELVHSCECSTLPGTVPPVQPTQASPSTSSRVSTTLPPAPPFWGALPSQETYLIEGAKFSLPQGWEMLMSLINICKVFSWPTVDSGSAIPHN